VCQPVNLTKKKGTFMSDYILTEKETRAKTKLSRDTRKRLEAQGKFPRPYRISPGRSGYIESEVDEWIVNLSQEVVEA
jgi:predicted DNA-binding transcriptional regulator AlpA